MATDVTVRVIRTWDIVIPAEYGDTPESLKAKISEQQLDDTPPNAETRVLLPLAESEHATLQEYEAAHPEEYDLTLTPTKEPV